ncbi:MAG: TatD family hydrolase [Methanoculleaceae archaeon]
MNNPRIPLTDDHMHIDPVHGRGVEAAMEFRRSGGTHIFLVTRPSWSYGVTPRCGDDFIPVFEETIRLAGEIRERGLTAFPVVGVHPAEITRLSEFMTVDDAARVMEEGISVACRYVAEGRAVAIKSGRPHYEVSPEVWEASNRVLRHALICAGEVGCAVQIHAESGPCADVVDMARDAGMSPERVVKHFAVPGTPLTPSFLATHEAVPDLFRQSVRFMMETDYIDDNTRPGSVIGPRSVPRVTLRLLREGRITDDDAWRVHAETPERVYGVEISL